MFLKERQAEIVSLLDANGRVTVSDLAQRFGVTEDCIRKDLKQIDEQGKCHRVYGGAISCATLPERNVFSRINTSRPEKRAIAEKALRLIKPGQTVFLDISTTNLQLAELLAASDVSCMVVSNMLDVLKTVAKNPGITATCPGGTVNLELNGLVSAATLAMLERMRFDVSFLGAVGVDVEDDGVTTFDQEDSLIKECVLERSDACYLVADAHKLAACGNYRYAALSDFDGLIMEDRHLVDADRARELGIKVL